MTFQDLINLTKVYTRDTDSRIFTDMDVKMFINEGIDRIKHFNMFEGMEHLANLTDVPSLLPAAYHHILALYAASRLFDTDERFFEGTEKRNEFEHFFSEIRDKIENGTLEIKDENGNPAEGTIYVSDFVKDVYFTGVIVE